MTIGSPLSPIISNTYVENFEKAALEQTYLRSKIWLRCIDDIFTVRPHGEIKTEHVPEPCKRIKINNQAYHRKKGNSNTSLPRCTSGQKQHYHQDKCIEKTDSQNGTTAIRIHKRSQLEKGMSNFKSHINKKWIPNIIYKQSPQKKPETRPRQSGNCERHRGNTVHLGNKRRIRRNRKKEIQTTNNAT